MYEFANEYPSDHYSFSYLLYKEQKTKHHIPVKTHTAEFHTFNETKKQKSIQKSPANVMSPLTGPNLGPATALF